MNAASLPGIRHTTTSPIARLYSPKTRFTATHSSRSHPSSGKTTVTSTPLKMSQSESEVSKHADGPMNNEPLLKHYTCAWIKEGGILLHGRMSVTPFHIYFHSNILGWETKLWISFKDVTDITKQKTARLFSNAIAITTVEREYFLTSFMHRNHAFRVLQLVWKYSMKGIALTKDDLSQLIKQQQQLNSVDISVIGLPDESDECSTDGPHKRSEAVQERFTESSTTASSGSTHSDSLDDDYNNSQHSETTLTEKPTTDNSESSSTSSAKLPSNVTPTELVKDPLLVLQQQHHQQERIRLGEGTRTAIVNHKFNPAQVINVIIMGMIVLLLISMLSIICKLCELDPNLKSWLLWQPWCSLVCDHHSLPD